MWTTQLLVVLVFLLSISSLNNHVQQSKLLVQCQEKQTRSQERLDAVLRAIWGERQAEQVKVLEKESAQTSRVASFLTEVLVTRQVNRKTDFESLYKQCNEQAKYVNESLAEVIQGLRYRLAGTESTVEKAKETARQALHEAQLAKNETNLAKRKTLKDIQIARSNEHVL